MLPVNVRVDPAHLALKVFDGAQTYFLRIGKGVAYSWFFRPARRMSHVSLSLTTAPRRLPAFAGHFLAIHNTLRPAICSLRINKYPAQAFTLAKRLAGLDPHAAPTWWNAARIRRVPMLKRTAPNS